MLRAIHHRRGRLRRRRWHCIARVFDPAPANPAAAGRARGIFALTAGTEAEAERLFSSRALARLWRDQGRFLPLPSPEEAAAYPYSDAERAHLERLRARALIGTPTRVRAGIERMAAECGAEEVAILSPCHDAGARAESYRLLAREFGLGEARLAA